MAEKSRWLEDEAAGHIAFVVKKNKMMDPCSQLAFSVFAKNMYFIFIYMLHVNMHLEVCSAHGDQKGESDSIELQLETFPATNVDAGSQTPVFCKNRKCF